MMSLRPRLIVLVFAIPIFAAAIIGGFMERATAGEDTYRHLRIFEDVVSLISRNYVEEVDLDSVMSGALRGLSEGLDSDSSYIAREDVERLESGRPLPVGSVGLDVTRGYYVQIISVADASPAAEAGILSGDYIRAIDGAPTRFMSGIEGARLLRGQPGSAVTVSLIRGNTQEPYDIELVRQRLSEPGVSSRLLSDAIGYVRIGGFNPGISTDISSTINILLEDGAKTLILDVRNNATGSFDEGISAARLFLGDGTVGIRAESDDQQISFTSETGDAAIEEPLLLLTNFGTSGPAEVFAAALVERERANSVGQRTAGRTSQQKLIRLPDGTGLWLSWARYLRPSGEPLHRVGVEPTIAVAIRQTELGEPLPTGDSILEDALEHLASRL